MNFTILRRVDWQLVAPVLVLLFISLATLFSINVALFRNQLLFSFVGIGLFIFFAQTDIRTWEDFAKPIYVLSVAGLIILLVLGIESRGAVRWLTFFGYGIQFSELFKPFLALSLASFLATRKDTSLSTLGKLTLCLLPVVFLIYKQPDLGSALMYIFA